MQHYLHRYFSKIVFLASAINTNFSRLWVFGWFRCLSLISLIGLTKREIHLSRTPLPKQSVFFMVSTFWCQIFSTLLCWGRRTKFKQENSIVDTGPTSTFLLCHTYFYVYWCTKFKFNWVNLISIYSMWILKLSIKLRIGILKVSKKFFRKPPWRKTALSVIFIVDWILICRSPRTR